MSTLALVVALACSAVVVADVPSPTCQAQMDRYCNIGGGWGPNATCAIVGPTSPKCTNPLFAANSSGNGHGERHPSPRALRRALSRPKRWIVIERDWKQSLRRGG